MSSCDQCQCVEPLGFAIRMAFQPIVNLATADIYAYEALVRGPQGEGAAWVLAQIDSNNQYSFDQMCRSTAIETICQLDPQARVSINFMPNAIYDPATCIQRTLQAAKRHNYPPTNIIFEFTEQERIEDYPKLKRTITCYQEMGFLTAIDDFGEGFAGLVTLVDFQPDLIKIDKKLVQGVATDAVKQAVVAGICETAGCLNIRLLAEGVETIDDCRYLRTQGIELMQGFLFAKPQLESLPTVVFDDVAVTS